MKTQSRRAGQRGSALLIVLVFAAMIAIMLYRELPVATFEAQRQKEQLLIDRGNEYSRAVKLYVRKFQTFPPSLEALENTNRMRFLRDRYVDPYTGKADWRILHAGPGGMITDSKLKQNGLNGAGAAGGSATGSNSGSTLGAPSSVTNPFANSFDGSNPMGAGQQGNNFPQRPPAISVNGGGGNGDATLSMPQDASQLDPQALAAVLAAQNQAGQNQAAASTGVPYPGYPGPPTGGLMGQAGNTQPDPSQNGVGNPTATSSGPYAGGPGRFRGGNPMGDSYPPGQFGNSSGGTTSVTGAGPSDPQTMMHNLLNTQNAPPVPNNNNSTGSSSFGSSSFGSNSGATGATGTQMGAMNNNNTTGGGIAGVASKSTGKTIKIVNDQTDRSLWEFVYDMQKDAMANASAAGGNSGIGGNNNSTNSSGTNSSGSNSTSFPGSTATGVPGQSSSFSPNGGSSPGSAFSIPPPQPVPQPQNQ